MNLRIENLEAMLVFLEVSQFSLSHVWKLHLCHQLQEIRAYVRVLCSHFSKLMRIPPKMVWEQLLI